jgi:hypothetical protein
VRANLKAGGINPNHSTTSLRVKSTVKAGGINPNHNRTGLKVKSGFKAGMHFGQNHSRLLLTA